MSCPHTCEWLLLAAAAAAATEECLQAAGPYRQQKNKTADLLCAAAACAGVLTGSRLLNTALCVPAVAVRPCRSFDMEQYVGFPGRLGSSYFKEKG
jgi:hypothetical protein